MIQTPHFMKPEMMNFLGWPKQWWNFSVILIDLDWPISRSQSIFLIHNTVLSCLVIMLRSRSVWLSAGTAAHSCHFYPFKYSVFLFRPFETEKYLCLPTIPEVNPWYPLSARREEQRQGLCFFCSHESLCNECKCTSSKKATDNACAPFSDNLLLCCLQTV